MCSGPDLIGKLPADLLLSGVIALDIEGPKLFRYSDLGKGGIKHLKESGAIICKFRGYRAKLRLKMRRLRAAYYAQISQAA
jgi:hypothetical protein